VEIKTRSEQTMIGTETPALVALKERLRTITALNRAANVLAWDQRTYMPAGGLQARAEQSAALRRLAHAHLVDPHVGDVIERAQDEVADLAAESDDACTVRIARRDYGFATRLPEEFVAQRSRQAALANGVWIEARRRDDFASFLPCIGYAEHPMDALIAQLEPGMTTASVRALFADLRTALVPLVRRIAPRLARVDDSVLHRPYDEATQERIGKEVVTRFGYDFTRGRLDRTTHPFEIAIARDDVRITTRYSPNFLPMALMGTMHEAGHGMYEQGISPALDGLPLGRGASPGMHESQSRLWENFVGRSRPFCDYLFPRLQDAFPAALGEVAVETFYRAINKVHPSLIRVEADEVTYCLHIMMRFELEIALMDGSLDPEDAPRAWREMMREYLGIEPSNDREGVLQDIHWSSGLGGFQGYALGNIIAGQLWEAILAAHPTMPRQIAQGEFTTLLEWLSTNIYQYGRKYDPGDLVERATGSPLHTQPYLRYLQTKFGEIYDL
jgi:carboxypeptidase Taq